MKVKNNYNINSNSNIQNNSIDALIKIMHFMKSKNKIKRKWNKDTIYYQQCKKRNNPRFNQIERKL